MNKSDDANCQHLTRPYCNLLSDSDRWTVKLKSPELETYLRREVALFRDMLRSSEGQNSGQITLEFYRKNKGRWLFPGENSPWEVWTIKLDVVNLQSENDRADFKSKLSEQLTEKVFSIIDIINRHEYLPRVPTRDEEVTVFDTSFMDFQPYLFKIYHQATGPSPTSVGTTMRKFLRGSLAL
ncbi:autophagy-related protein 101-like [Elysia marginata]|uniref:Autophagy-related protein 101 n=1 Tax=Elysia marginata TaxID=1093978 RepID=A0AAV4FAG9_9GAST|nr:autophagy-related protein 101-like [Elysia marginata]